MTTERLETFSDGVLAIAITLLVLDLRASGAEPGGLGRLLLDRWPSFAAYFVSFLVIGIMWVNHHSMFRYIARTDRPLLFLNLLLLMFVAAVPFPTGLLAEYIREGSNSHIAAALYSGTFLLISLCFNGMWLWVINHGLLEDRIDPARARAITLRWGLGPVVYAVTVALSFISAPLTLAVHFLIAVYYAFDQLRVEPDGTEGQCPVS